MVDNNIVNTTQVLYYRKDTKGGQRHRYDRENIPAIKTCAVLLENVDIVSMYSG